VKVRPDAPIEIIAPFGCSIQTGAGAVFNSLRPEPGSSCIVFGAGSVGLSAVMAAKILGCDPIIAVEPREARRLLALELGATQAVDPVAVDDLAAVLIDATGGGADAIIETTGLADVVSAAISVLGRCGNLALIGMHDMQAKADFSILELISKGASIHGIIEGSSEPHGFIPYLVDLFMDGRFPVDKLVTFFPFEDINDAVAAQASGRVVKPILRFEKATKRSSRCFAIKSSRRSRFHRCADLPDLQDRQGRWS
jgi:aryl-alcohol dehydrogenase